MYIYVLTLGKYIFFIIHIGFILSSILLLFYYWQILILHFIVLLSWYFNQNKCLLTQIEDYLFHQTIIDFYFQIIYKKKYRKYKKFIVPYYHRYCLYFFSILGFFFHFIF
jgi:hypothetical protein